MLTGLRTVGERYLPGIFGVLSDVADRNVARDGASEIQLLPLLVRPGELACDVGANRGLFSYWLLRLGARVATFEPNPRMARVLRHRFAAALKQGRLRLFEGAVSDRPGSAELHVPRGYSPLATIDGSALSQDLAVDVVAVNRLRLDDCVGEDVAFIKIDVEGHEQHVLDGARRLLLAYKPTLLIEAEERHRHGAVAGLRASLEPLGYEGFFVLADGLHPMSGFDPARHQRLDALNEAGTGALTPFGYVNNFVFVARPEVRERLAGWRPHRTLGVS